MPDLTRLHTLPLQQGDVVTKALVLLNTTDAPFSGVAVFHASYPIRVPPGPQPVTVRDLSGDILPSRIVHGKLTDVPGLPEGKRLWTFDLQVLVADVLAQSGTAYAAIYGESPESNAPEAVWEAAFAAAPLLRLMETDIHTGDIPLPCRLSDIMDPVPG